MSTFFANQDMETHLANILRNMEVRVQSITAHAPVDSLHYVEVVLVLHAGKDKASAVLADAIDPQTKERYEQEIKALQDDYRGLRSHFLQLEGAYKTMNHNYTKSQAHLSLALEHLDDEALIIDGGDMVDRINKPKKISESHVDGKLVLTVVEL